MGTVVGEILPLAIGIALSPVPIIAAILMLLSPRARSSGVGFLVGWVLGIVVAVVIFTLLSSMFLEGGSEGSQPVSGAIRIALGALMLLFAARTWRSRPRGGEEPPLPKWMASIGTMTAGRALLLGFALSALNPKNLIMGVSAGVAIGGSDLDTGRTLAAMAIYTAVAASTVAVPVIGYLVARRRMAAPLEALRGWLVHNNATILTVLLLVIGFVIIGKGIASF
ncbi:MAG: GAP family protein [Mycetocola sp.]